VPSVSTIWRVLRRRGFVVPHPHKRPRSSWIRFEATLPNECWQSEDPLAPEPATTSRVGDTITALGAANGATRAPMCTASRWIS
jgi:hypothetical protein